jgi:hypothetical protein
LIQYELVFLGHRKNIHLNKCLQGCALALKKSDISINLQANLEKKIKSTGRED